MPANARPGRVSPKRELKRGFWWTLGTLAAYALVGAAAIAAARYLGGQEGGFAVQAEVQARACPSPYAQ